MEKKKKVESMQIDKSNIINTIVDNVNMVCGLYKYLRFAIFLRYSYIAKGNIERRCRLANKKN